MVMHRIGSATPQGIGCSSHLLSASFIGAFVYRLVREIVDLLGAVRLRYAPPFILQDGYGRAVMSSEAWWLVRVKVVKRFDSPICTR